MGAFWRWLIGVDRGNGEADPVNEVRTIELTVWGPDAVIGTVRFRHDSCRYIGRDLWVFQSAEEQATEKARKAVNEGIAIADTFYSPHSIGRVDFAIIERDEPTP